MISAAVKTRDLPTQINHFSEEVALIEDLACSFIECSRSRFLRRFRKSVSLKLIQFWFGKPILGIFMFLYRLFKVTVFAAV